MIGQNEQTHTTVCCCVISSPILLVKFVTSSLIDTHALESCALFTINRNAAAAFLARAQDLAGHALADLGQNGVVLDVIRVVGLQLDGDAVESALQGVLGGGVHHLGLDGVSAFCVWEKVMSAAGLD